MSSTVFPTDYFATLPRDPDAALIDKMIERLEASPEAARSLLLEHLQSARFYLMGAMPAEYKHNLKLARDAGKYLENRDLRKELAETIDRLNNDVRPKVGSHPDAAHDPTFQAPGTAEADLDHFFNKETDSSFGVFYPKHCIIAVLASLRDAVAVGAALVDYGLDKHNVIVARGSQMIRFFSHPSALGTVMAPISRMFGTEQQMVDRSVELARKGAGFVAIHVASEAEAQRIRDLLKPFEPLAAWFYQPSGIQSLV